MRENSEKEKELIVIDHLPEELMPKKTAKELAEEINGVDIVIDAYGYGYV